MAAVDVPLKRLRFGQTARKDAWWVMPLLTFVVFTSFIVYATWALLQGDHYCVRQLPVAVLLAGVVRRLAARLVRARRRPGGRLRCRSRRPC